MVRISPGKTLPNATQIIDVVAELHTLAIPYIQAPYVCTILVTYFQKFLVLSFIAFSNQLPHHVRHHINCMHILLYNKKKYINKIKIYN